MRKGERLSIVMFIAIFTLAVCEFVFLPDGIGLRLAEDGFKHYYRIKPFEILLPIAVGSLGAGLTHHGTIRKGIFFFVISMLIFLFFFAYQL